MTIKIILVFAHKAAKDKADMFYFKTAFSQYWKYQKGEFGETGE